MQMVNHIVGFITEQPISIILTILIILVVIDRWTGLTAHRHRTIEIMVNKLHEYVTEFYMPSLVAARSFFKRLGNWRTEGELSKLTEPKIKDAFYFLALFFQIRNALIEKTGGFFLRDLRAEIALSVHNGDVATGLEAAIGRDNFTLFEECLKNTETRGDFLARISTDSDLEAAYHQFLDWIQNKQPQNVLESLNAYVELMQLEINIPYSPWYRREWHLWYRLPLTISAESIDLTIKRLREMRYIPEPQIVAYKKKLARYND